MKALFSLPRTSASISSLLSRPILPLPILASTQANFSTPSLDDSPKVTPEELARINLLIPRLCDGGRFREASRLVDACLLAQTPLQSLSLSVLVSRMCSSDRTAQAEAAALLDAVERNPRSTPDALLTVSSMLIASYFKNRCPAEAMAVFRRMCRPGSLCPPDPEAYRVVIVGLCRAGKTRDALAVMREALGKLVAGPDTRAAVYRSLLREARIREAMEVERALRELAEGMERADVAAAEVLDRVVREWED